MSRYFFHLASPTHPVRDRNGVDLAGLDAAHWHAMRLVYRLRAHAAETGEDWVIHKRHRTRLLGDLAQHWHRARQHHAQPELGGSLSKSGGYPGKRDPVPR